MTVRSVALSVSPVSHMSRYLQVLDMNPQLGELSFTFYRLVWNGLQHHLAPL